MQKVKLRLQNYTDMEQGIKIEHKEPYMEYMLECSLKDKTVWHRKKGTRGLNAQGRGRQLDKGTQNDTLGRESNQTHLRDMARQEVVNRHIGISTTLSVPN